MKRNKTGMKTYKLQQENYQMRTYKYNGKDHLIVPVIMMREGVHSGSHGPILHTTAELNKSVEAWNGQPVVIHHPQNEQGVYVSANLPKVREKEEVGIVFNTHMEEDKLKAELWLDVTKMTNQALETLNAIKSLEPMDVSVGIYTDEQEIEGEWNGETYSAIALNYRPDHLAILPGEVGACSWADGCGIRTNKKEEVMTKKETETAVKKERIVDNNLTTNAAISFNDISDKLRDKIRPLNTQSTATQSGTYHYLSSVFPDYFIYEREATEGERSFFKQGYALDANNDTQLIGEPIEVKREIIYTPVQQVQTNKNGGKKMTPCCREKVNSLITNKVTPWSEKNREWLEAQDEPIIDNLVLEMNRKASNEEAVQVLTSEIKTSEDVLKLLPKDSVVRTEIEEGLNLHKAARQEKIDHILNNTEEGIWTKEQLNAMPTEVVVNIAKSIPADTSKKVDYSANGNVQVNTTADDEVLLPVGVVASK